MPLFRNPPRELNYLFVHGTRPMCVRCWDETKAERQEKAEVRK